MMDFMNKDDMTAEEYAQANGVDVNEIPTVKKINGKKVIRLVVDTAIIVAAGVTGYVLGGKAMHEHLNELENESDDFEM